MPPDDEADNEFGGFGPPLPPDDRLWRHPSEVANLGLPDRIAPTRPGAPDGRAPAWPIALVAGLVGAALSTGILAVTGAFSAEVVEHSVVEKVAVTPIVSSPMVQGERGVVAVAERLGPSVAQLVFPRQEGSVTGSGVIFRDDGLVLTSARLVGDATEVAVELADGRHFDGELIGLDRSTDVAVVKIDGEGLPVAVLGTSEHLEVGAPTIAIGFAPTTSGDPSVATGVISAIERRIDEGGDSLHGMIQTDAPIEEGASGGPLVDANGSVIGIITPMASGPGAQFGFATPIDLARRVAGELVATGRAVHGWLGIEGADLTSEQAAAMGIDGGARIRGIAGDSPADGAGLSPDDVITEIDGAQVDSTSGLVVRMRDHKPGDKIVIGYWRDGEHDEATVTVGELP